MKIEYSRVSLFLEKKEKILSTAIFIFALLIATSIYISQTKSLRLLNIKRDTQIKKNEVLNEIRQSEKKIKFYSNLLNEKDASSITNTISNIAKESGVQIISIEPGREEKQSLFIKYPFILTIHADSYHAIGKFITKIESYSDAYIVETTSIRPLSEVLNKELDETAAKTNKLIVNLTLNIIAFTG